MESALKILHLEDNLEDAGLIERELKKAGFHFIIKLVDTKEEYISALQNFNPDVILSDHSLPQFNSMNALKIYKEYHFEIPFILITGAVSEEFAISSIKEGADDYILKNNLIRLPSAIEQALKARKIESEKRRANSELELINKELNTFIYKAAHDLRGPLCSIMGLINVAEQQDEKTNLSVYLQKISEGTRKLDDVLLSLMEVMSVKNITPLIREINFDLLMQDILAQLKISEPLNTIDIKVALNIQAAFYSDETILKTILLNLLTNAIQYRDVRKPHPYIKLTISQQKKELVIVVEDNGMGMKKEFQENIFEMYYRGNQYSKGPGLGLYITKTGVKKLNGSIDVSSEVMTGSTFTVRLPLV